MTSSRFAAIADDLRERIALGDVAASGAVESEAELGRRYEVSRPTVRRALEQLRRVVAETPTQHPHHASRVRRAERLVGELRGAAT